MLRSELLGSTSHVPRMTHEAAALGHSRFRVCVGDEVWMTGLRGIRGTAQPERLVASRADTDQLKPQPRVLVPEFLCRSAPVDGGADEATPLGLSRLDVIVADEVGPVLRKLL